MPTCPECKARFEHPAKGLQTFCSRSCRLKAWRRKRYRDDPEKMREEWRTAHERNREKRLERMHAYYQKNHDAIRAQVKEHRKVDGNRLRAQDRARWTGERQERGNTKRKEHAQATRITLPWKPLLKSASDRAQQEGLEFTLTEQWARDNWTGKCALTNIPFVLGQRGSGPKHRSPSIDRIVPNLGYTPNNCRFILALANLIKKDRINVDTDVISATVSLLSH